MRYYMGNLLLLPLGRRGKVPPSIRWSMSVQVGAGQLVCPGSCLVVSVLISTGRVCFLSQEQVVVVVHLQQLLILFTEGRQRVMLPLESKRRIGSMQLFWVWS